MIQFQMLRKPTKSTTGNAQFTTAQLNTSTIRNHHISTKHPKAEHKDFTIMDIDRNILHHQTKEALHIHIKDPSLNRNTSKVRIPSVFNKLLNLSDNYNIHIVLSPHHSHSSIPHPRLGHLLHLVF